MPKLTIGGTEIKGVMKAEVRILHGTTREPERWPVMEWDIVLGLQNEDFLGKWALAPQGTERFKRCELAIHHREGGVAHTWVILKAYAHEYREVEFPEQGVPGNASDAGYYIRLLIRGTLPQAQDYTGDNVMTVAAGGAETLPS